MVIRKIKNTILDYVINTILRNQVVRFKMTYLPSTYYIYKELTHTKIGTTNDFSKNMVIIQYLIFLFHKIQFYNPLSI